MSLGGFWHLCSDLVCVGKTLITSLLHLLFLFYTFFSLLVFFSIDIITSRYFYIHEHAPCTTSSGLPSQEIAVLFGRVSGMGCQGAEVEAGDEIYPLHRRVQGAADRSGI